MDKKTVCVDAGSFTTKIGFAGEQPNTLPSIYESKENQKKRPVDHSLPVDLNIYQDFLTQIFETQNYKTEQHRMVFTEKFNISKKEREDLTQLMFENFQIPSYYVSKANISSMFSYGITTGVSIGIGHENTEITPIYEGYGLPDCFSEFPISGIHLSEMLEKELKFDSLIIQDIKEKLCYSTGDYDKELKEYNSQHYSLPDGTVIDLGKELFTVPEILFQPDSNLKGIHEWIAESISKTDVEMHSEFFGNVTLNGGTTELTGFSQRLSKEIQSLTISKVKVLDSVQRNSLAAWNGLSLFGSLETIGSSNWISKEDFDDNGPSIVNKKCF
jgi:actin, other eukaryote